MLVYCLQTDTGQYFLLFNFYIHVYNMYNSLALKTLSFSGKGCKKVLIFLAYDHMYILHTLRKHAYALCSDFERV